MENKSYLFFMVTDFDTDYYHNSNNKDDQRRAARCKELKNLYGDSITFEQVVLENEKDGGSSEWIFQGDRFTYYNDYLE